MKSIVSRCWFLIDRAWVERREALLVAAEDAIFRAARDRAKTPEERAYWNAFLAVRATNARRDAARSE